MTKERMADISRLTLTVVVLLAIFIWAWKADRRSDVLYGKQAQDLRRANEIIAKQQQKYKDLKYRYDILVRYTLTERSYQFPKSVENGKEFIKKLEEK